MKCPLAAIACIISPRNAAKLSDECLKEECAWWNDYFAMCSQAVDAFLKGQEDWRKERAH